MKCFLVVLSLVLCCKHGSGEEISAYIVNGQRAPPLPYYAFVVALNADELGVFGGGTLISDRHIITSASNIMDFVFWRVGLGATHRANLRNFNSTQAIRHPQYNPQSRANDIGVITLNQLVVFTADIDRIALTPINDQQNIASWPMVNEEGSVAGYGYTSATSNAVNPVLYRGYQRVIENARCTRFFIVNQPNHFCAEDTIEGSNICGGDIGGGFVTTTRRENILTGVASISAPCGQPAPSAYTRISAYRNWLQGVVGF